MKLKKVKIHHFRSIIDEEFNLEDFSMLIGENNSGKSNIISAIRIFYEDEIKFSKEDFPKIQNLSDDESWIELSFETTASEQEGLKEEYRSSDNILKVRKYLKGTLAKASQSNIYAYENGSLSENLFYGAKNISESKLGNLIFIPELSKVDENTKMSGPSPLRGMIKFVMNKAVKQSDSFAKLEETFSKFNEEFKEETTDGFSIEKVEDDINQEMSQWGVKFGLTVQQIRPEDIIKNLVSHHVSDDNLEDQQMKIECFGQGLQRHLIYTLIKLSSKYKDSKVSEKKDFSPDFTLILFEEPEAFLHPMQQERLNVSLKELSTEESQQILITSHSPLFVSRNTETLISIIKTRRDQGKTKINQISKEDEGVLFDENSGMFQHFLLKLNNPAVGDPIKAKIRTRGLAHETMSLNSKLEEESFRYFLWLDSERSSLFFAKKVIICEGASEKIFFDYLLDTAWSDLKEKQVYVLDSLGKYNIHRYMNLFNKLEISHSVLMDKDNDPDIHSEINQFIENNQNDSTDKIEYFDKDLEDFLEIDKPSRKDLKPMNVMLKYSNGEIDPAKISLLKTKFESLI